MGRVWVDLGTAKWGPVQRCITTCRRLGYEAVRFGLRNDVLVLVSGPGGIAEPSRPAVARRDRPAIAGAGTARVTIDRRGRPATVLDDLGETWTVTTVTGVWVQLGAVPTAGVRTAWRVRVGCWHTPPPGAAAVLEHRGDGSWRLRPPR